MYAAVQGTCGISPLEVLVPGDSTVLDDNAVLDDEIVLEDKVVLDDKLTVELDDEVVSLVVDEDNEDEGAVLELVVDVVDTGAILLVLDVDADDDVGCSTLR